MRILALLIVCAVVLAGLVRGLLIQTFSVPTNSMEPTITAGDRITVWRPDGLTGTIDRGDVVVLDGRGSFIPGKQASGIEKLGSWFGIGPRDVFYTKRVIGISGDRVTCCDARGQLTVNGEPLNESYLMVPVGIQDEKAGAGAHASATEFDVAVPAGRVWLMGDNRANSTDSRNLLGSPGGGMIRTSEILGVVVGHGASVDRD